MKRWLVPIRLVEMDRVAVVTAETAADAIRKTREAEWDELCEATEFKITIRGKVSEAKES